MTRISRRRDPCRFHHLIMVLGLVAACSGGGGSGDCTTCPGEVENASLRLSIDYGSAPAGSLMPAGFRVQDVRRVDIAIVGSAGEERLSLPAPIDAAFVTLAPGVYGIGAIAFGDSELVLFREETNVTLAAGDTVDIELDLEVALGPVTLTVNGRTDGRIEARAGDEIPFTVLVTNTAGRGVPNSLVALAPNPTGFASIELANDGRTDAAGAVSGLIRAPHSGQLTFALRVDGLAVDAGSGIQLAFATSVSAGASTVTIPGQTLLMANGGDFAEFEVVVRNRDDEVLAGVPVVVTSNRNTGVEPEVDVLRPLPGFESGKTDQAGIFRFQVRSTTSSFLRLNPEGRLFSPPLAGFIPAAIEVRADGIIVGARTITFNSTVNPQRGNFTIAPQFLPANGTASAVISVEAINLNGGPVRNAVVELVNSLGTNLNHVLNITPEPGFSGFRTNDQGVWRGRIRSTVRGPIFLNVKVDGRQLAGPPRSVIFQ